MNSEVQVATGLELPHEHTLAVNTAFAPLFRRVSSKRNVPWNECHRYADGARRWLHTKNDVHPRARSTAQ
jgi:hypothetical protein